MVCWGRTCFFRILVQYLQDAVAEYNGIAMVIEKDSNYLIANSMGIANFQVLEDGTLEHYRPDDIEDIDVHAAYEQFNKNSAPQQLYKGENDNYFINTREIHLNGIDWVVISAIPASGFYDGCNKKYALGGTHCGTVSAVFRVLAYYIID